MDRLLWQLSVLSFLTNIGLGMVSATMLAVADGVGACAYGTATPRSRTWLNFLALTPAAVCTHPIDYDFPAACNLSSNFTC